MEEKSKKKKLIVDAYGNGIVYNGKWESPYLELEIDNDEITIPEDEIDPSEEGDYVRITILFKTKDKCFDSICDITYGNGVFKCEASEEKDLIVITRVEEEDCMFVERDGYDEYKYIVDVKINYLSGYSVTVHLKED